MTEATDPFWDTVDALRENDPSFRREAYGFVVGALGRTVLELPEGRRRDPERRHLTGQELLAGVIRCARQEFGALSPNGGSRRVRTWVASFSSSSRRDS